jgi:hypothetical protein
LSTFQNGTPPPWTFEHKSGLDFFEYHDLYQQSHWMNWIAPPPKKGARRTREFMTLGEALVVMEKDLNLNGTKSMVAVAGSCLKSQRGQQIL